MKTPSPKVLLTVAMAAFGIAATLTSPAFAQYHQPSRHERSLQSRDYAPTYPQQQNSNIPYYGNAPYDQRDDW